MLSVFECQPDDLVPVLEVPLELRGAKGRIGMDVALVPRGAESALVIQMGADGASAGWYGYVAPTLALINTVGDAASQRFIEAMRSARHEWASVYEIRNSQLIEQFTRSEPLEPFVQNLRHFVVPGDCQWVHLVQDGELHGQWFTPAEESDFLEVFGLRPIWSEGRNND